MPPDTGAPRSCVMKRLSYIFKLHQVSASQPSRTIAPACLTLRLTSMPCAGKCVCLFAPPDTSFALQVLVLDNRGVGRSSMPRNKSAYSTTSMAMDVLCIMVSAQDDVGQSVSWRQLYACYGLCAFPYTYSLLDYKCFKEACSLGIS